MFLKKISKGMQCFVLPLLLIAMFCMSCGSSKHEQPPGKMTQQSTKLEGNKKKPQQDPTFGAIKASDNIDLAYASYIPDHPQAALVFYHGSGAHGSAGYTYMAEQLCNRYKIATYLFDIRGHGRSGGLRGHTPTDAQVWHDVRTAYEFVKQQHPECAVFLGGHSGGAGMLLNYAHWLAHEDPSGYLLVTPFLGKDVDIFREREKKSERSFATIHFAALIINKLSFGLLAGDWIGMRMQYPEHYITELGFVNTYTVNMIKALNAHAPLDTLRNMPVPTYIFIADQDELFDPEKMDRVLADAVAANNLLTIEHLQTKHLTVLGEVHEHVGKAIRIQLFNTDSACATDALS